MLPFFVVDRPMSLKILHDYCAYYPEVTFGLMTHSLTTSNFQAQYALFSDGLPQTTKLSARDLTDTSCSDNKKGHIIKMADSGIFRSMEKRGGHSTLFEKYDKMGVDFGVAIDFMRDHEKTVQAAEEALAVHEEGEYSFRLVTVAQGETQADYLQCYQDLKDLGSDYIAIGGLLKKQLNSARFAIMRNEDALKAVVQSVRSEYDPNWLFVLGAYHPSRHDFFTEQDVWGSDYKGWIFSYVNKADRLQQLHKEVAGKERQLLNDPALKGLVTRRTNLYFKMKQHQRDYNAARERKDKEAAWRESREARRRCLRLDKSIIARRMGYISQNNLPQEYKETVYKMQKISEKSDQDMRRDGLHRYLDLTILPRLIGF